MHKQIGYLHMSSSGSFELINHLLVPDVWPAIEKMVEKVVNKTGEEDILEVFNHLANDFYQLWVYVEDNKVKMCTITLVYEGHKERQLIVKYVVGRELNAWLDHDTKLVEFGKEHGCEIMITYARPGLVRPLKEHGWKIRQIRLNKEIK